MVRVGLFHFEFGWTLPLTLTVFFYFHRFSLFFCINNITNSTQYQNILYNPFSFTGYIIILNIKIFKTINGLGGKKYATISKFSNITANNLLYLN